MSKNINPDVKKMISDRIAYERSLSEKSKVGYNAKRKTQALVTGTLLATTLSSGIAPVFADSYYDDAQYKGVGYISVTEEVGYKGDGSMISTGEGDAGGVSYGLTQLSSVVGSADEFVDNYLKNNYPEYHKFFENADRAGTDSFNEAWTNAYNHNPGEFEKIQLENKEVNYVQPTYKNVKDKFGIDLLSTRAKTEFLHSTSVQFGPAGVVTLFEKSGVTKDMDDEELLSKLSDEKYNSVGTYKFMKCRADVQESVRNRFIREKEEYIKIAKEEKGPLLEEEIDYSIMDTESSTDEFVDTAKGYLNQGTTYKMGGKNTDKLDCSGYVSLVYQDMGIDVDEMMTNAGKFRNDSTKISRDEIEVGDLVFWHDNTGTKHAKVFHIGIYVGNDTVVDCSIDHNGVGTRKLSSLQDTKDRYYTFGRFEELQEKISTPNSDLMLDLSDVDEFESDIEISDSVEEKFEDEVVEEDTEEDTEEDDSIIDDEAVEEDTEEDDSIIDDEAVEEDTEGEIEEDDSIIDDEAVEEDTEEDTEEDAEEDSGEADTIEPDSDDQSENEEDTTESDIDEETDSNNEENEDKVENDKETEEDSNEEDTTESDNNNESEKEEPVVDDESNEESTTEDNSTELEDNNESKEDTSTSNDEENNESEKKEDNSKQEEGNNESEIEDNKESEEVNVDSNEDTSDNTETLIASSDSDSRIERLEKKLENNIFSNLFKM